jgi:2-methylisocitrate lyase-like PEP mutase family enzyme
MIPLITPEGRLETIQRLLATLPAGISGLLLHPAKDTPELRAFTKDWRARAADYSAFGSEAVRTLFKESGVHVIGWQILRDLMREAMQ